MDMQLTSSVVIKIDGKTFRTIKGATFDPGGKKKTSRAGSTRINGFTTEVVPSKLEFEINVGPETSLIDIANIDNATVSIEADTGQSWVINGAWVTDPPVLDESEGKTKITLEGQPAEET